MDFIQCFLNGQALSLNCHARAQGVEFRQHRVVWLFLGKRLDEPRQFVRRDFSLTSNRLVIEITHIILQFRRGENVNGRQTHCCVDAAEGGHAIAFPAVFRQSKAMSDKQLALESIQRLPEDVALDAIAERLDFLAGIRKGLNQIERGETVSHDEIKRHLATWLTK